MKCFDGNSGIQIVIDIVDQMPLVPQIKCYKAWGTNVIYQVPVLR